MHNRTSRSYSPLHRAPQVLGQSAVHGAFAGYTGVTVGLVNTHYVYLPIPTIIQSVRRINPNGRRWNRLKTSIKQPDLV